MPSRKYHAYRDILLVVGQYNCPGDDNPRALDFRYGQDFFEGAAGAAKYGVYKVIRVQRRSLNTPQRSLYQDVAISLPAALCEPQAVHYLVALPNRGSRFGSWNRHVSYERPPAKINRGRSSRKPAWQSSIQLCSVSIRHPCELPMVTSSATTQRKHSTA